VKISGCEVTEIFTFQILKRVDGVGLKIGNANPALENGTEVINPHVWLWPSQIAPELSSGRFGCLRVIGFQSIFHAISLLG
jgi:hypothetical protein